MRGRPQWIVLSLLLFFCTSVPARVSIPDCGDATDRYAEVNQDRDNFTLTCTGISAQNTVNWGLSRGSEQSSFQGGTCPPPDPVGDDSCDTSASQLKAVLVPRRTSLTDSEVVITVQRNTHILKDTSKVHCQEMSSPNKIASSDTCTIDLITPAAATCQGDFITSSRPWSVYVRCNITKGSSTRDRYKCRLHQKLDGQGERKLVGWRKMRENSLPSGSALCDFNVHLNITQPQHYSVEIIPGRLKTDITLPGGNEIRRPPAPTINCQPSGLVKENDALTCLCTVDSLGQPPGKLRWSRSFNNFDTDNPLKVGNGEETELTLTQTLTRNDHDVTKFRCDVVWASDITGPVKNATVGYLASQMTFRINRGSLVAENTVVTFTCTATDGRPQPTVTVSRADGSKVVDNQSSVTHRVPVVCEDGGPYTCTASNGMGPDVTRRTTLDVTCKPRNITGNTQFINYNDAETQTTFDVIAKPPPHKVSFTFLGSEGGKPPSEPKGISMSGQCKQKGEVVYRSTCTVTVHNVTSAGAAGMYRGTLTNLEGSLSFVFQVKVNATEPPEPPTAGHSLAAGIGGGLAVIIVLVIIIVIVIYRKKGSVEKTGHGNDIKYTAAANGQEREPAQSSPAIRQPLLSGDDHVMDPDDVYVNVRKEDYASQAKENDGAMRKPQQTGAIGQHDPDPDPAIQQADNVYAVVDKKKKRQKKPSASVPSDVHSEVKDSEVKDSEGTVDEGKGSSEAPVYGNLDMQGQAINGSQDAAPQDQQGDASGQERNEDGLLYVSVDFSDRPSTAFPRPTVVEDGVLYSAVDFGHAAPAQ